MGVERKVVPPHTSTEHCGAEPAAGRGRDPECRGTPASDQSTQQQHDTGAAVIQIALVDDHPLVLAGLQGLIEMEPDMRIVGRAATGRQALSLLREKRPDIAILDLSLPDIDGLELVRTLREEGLLTRFVLLTASITDAQALAALRLGVEGILLKEMSSELIVRCIRRVREGGRWLETHSIGRVLDKMLRGDAPVSDFERKLSPREQEVTRLVLAGLCNKKIALRLGVSEGTVKIHLYRIYQKLGVGSRLQLTVAAREQGFR